MSCCFSFQVLDKISGKLDKLKLLPSVYSSSFYIFLFPRHFKVCYIAVFCLHYFWKHCFHVVPCKRKRTSLSQFSFCVIMSEKCSLFCDSEYISWIVLFNAFFRWNLVYFTIFLLQYLLYCQNIIVDFPNWDSYLFFYRYKFV